MSDSDLDRRLREVGERWRLSVGAPPSIEPTILVDSRWQRLESSTPIRGLLAMAAIGVGLGAIGLAAGLWTTTGSGSDTSPVNPGDSVIAVGVVTADRDGVVLICDPLPSRLTGSGDGVAPKCSPIAVPIEALDVTSLPRWMADGDAGYVDHVAIYGTWTGHSIRATGSGEASVDSIAEPDVPCGPPAGGWPPGPASELEFETALSRLSSAVSADSELFSGYWVASSPGVTPTRVAVVGTVIDPTKVRPKLEASYPYPLCLAQVDHSAEDLALAAEKISDAMVSRGEGPWRVMVSQHLNRVVVRTPLVDDDLQRLLSGYPEAHADPLVRGV